ncbi:hypothetical protein [Algoriphagus sp.]|uniref:hypothetical protein n=1 Tax=Algoriphagus sp. TaxID=1872435 RepID=UPI0025FCE698|nr:hypothetical protein [Algoriphagus sp.]
MVGYSRQFLSGLVWQIHILRKTPSSGANNLSIIEKIQGYLAFYYKHYISTIYVGALSSSLFFIIGSIFYLQLKYQKIPSFQIDDFIVMNMGVLFSFGISAFAQLKHNNYRIQQLEQHLKELEDNSITELSIISYQNKRIKIGVFFGLSLVIGLILRFLLITKS